ADLAATFHHAAQHRLDVARCTVCSPWTVTKLIEFAAVQAQLGDDMMEHAEDVLEVSDLSIRFGRTSVLNDLTFSVPAGTTLAILGPNGAGKTVLFKALIGAIPHDGEIRWKPGTRIGYVPQKLDLERDVPITGVDFLRARAALARESDANIVSTLALVGVSADVAQRPIGILSGGQFQRLLIAFALVGNPTVLLLDEPTAGVDEPGQEQLNELVRRLQKDHGLTVLFISHELTVVYRYAMNVLCLSRPRAYIGPPKTILTPDLLHEMYGTPVDYHVHDH
ncbi:MAG TPA: metal ABC transporter ATP-binding protein, partial [Vicinamibacterales bacterium]|nr:metal ABC transporter ATP-binding protein [Vicinamibacterales bacterium]